MAGEGRVRRFPIYYRGDLPTTQVSFARDALPWYWAMLWADWEHRVIDNGDGTYTHCWNVKPQQEGGGDGG